MSYELTQEFYVKLCFNNFREMFSIDECRLEQSWEDLDSTKLNLRDGWLDEYIHVVEIESESVGSFSDVVRVSGIVEHGSSDGHYLSGGKTNLMDGGIRVISPVPSDLFDYKILVLKDLSVDKSEAARESVPEDFNSVQEDGNGDRFSAQVSRVRFSNSVKAKIATSSKRFFHSLPFEKQIILLRRSEHLAEQPKPVTHVCADLAQQLCAELKLDFQPLNSWLIRRLRFLKNVGNSLAPRHIRFLMDEFKLSPVLSDDRALLLGYVLQAPVSAIRRWFDLKRDGRLRVYHSSKAVSKNESVRSNFEIIEDEVSEEEPPSPSRSLIEDDPVSDPSVEVSNNRIRRVRRPSNCSEAPKGTRFPFKEYQLEILFQAFKRCPNLNSSRAEQLSLQSDVPKEKICGWFKKMRSSLDRIPSSVLLSSYRNENLTPEQVEVLEFEYQVYSFLDEDRLNLLADLLDLEKCLIKRWFLSKRCYDIAFFSNSSSDDEASALTPRLPVANLDPTTDDERVGQGSYTPARSEASHFSGVLDAENFLFSEENHLHDEPPEESSSQCRTHNVFDFKDDEEPIIPLVRPVVKLRRESAESSTSNLSSGVTGRVANALPKKRKLLLTRSQQIALRKEYRKSAYITPGEAQLLAANLGLSVKRVRLWFERMRLREKNLGTAGSTPTPGPRMRWPLKAWQKHMLQEEYKQNPTLTKKKLDMLCKKLEVSQPTIVCWFNEQKTQK